MEVLNLYQCDRFDTHYCFDCMLNVIREYSIQRIGCRLGLENSESLGDLRLESSYSVAVFIDVNLLKHF
jgi:hypothetical protein